MNKENKEELLSIINTAFAHLLRGIGYKETRTHYEQARKEIVALIKAPPELPEITEGWAAGKAKEILELIKQAVDEDLEDEVLMLRYLGRCLDFMTSVLNELSLKIKRTKRRGGCPPDFIPGKED